MSRFAEAHDELRAVARQLLGAPGPVDAKAMASAGWPGLEIPEALGGTGATFAEVAVVAEEVGRAAAAGPFLGPVVLGAGTVILAEPTAERDRLLSGIAAGTTQVAVALVDGAGDAVAAPAPFRLRTVAGGLVLDGRAGFVPDAGEADVLVLVALDPAGEPVVVRVPRHHPGVRVEASPVLDATRSLATIDAAGAPVGASDVWRFAGDPGAAVRRLRARAATALAIDGLGLSRAMLDATVAYAKVRVQFDRPIGSFQAVKHACADMRVSVAVTGQLVAAAVAACAGDGDADRAASMAKAHAGSAAVEIVGTALQLHGGIGYTWESGIHVHLKRALLDRSLFGSPRAHRRALGERYLAPAVAGGRPSG